MIGRILRKFTPLTRKFSNTPHYTELGWIKKENDCIRLDTWNKDFDGRPTSIREYSNKVERNELEARLFGCVRHQEKINPKQLKWEDDLKQTWGLDSLDMISLLTSIEHEFNILFPDNVFDTFENLEEVIDFLSNEAKVI